MNRYQQLRTNREIFGYSNRNVGAARSGRDMVRMSRRTGRVTISGS